MSRSRGEPLSLTATDRERFDASICRTSTCHIWLGSLSRPGGYGQWWLRRPDGRQRVVSAHRVAFELVHGPLPEGATLMHDCEVRLCVNTGPGHVHAATQAENVDQAVRRRRMAGPRPGLVDVRGPVGQADAVQTALRDVLAQGRPDPDQMAAVLADVIAAGDPLADQLRLL